MTEISAIIRARLDEGRAIADEDVRALLNENDMLRDARFHLKSECERLNNQIDLAERHTLNRAAKALDEFGDSIWNGNKNHRFTRCIVTIGDCDLIVRSLIEKETTND